MCFPDKITLLPAPVTQNTHRYQLACGRQDAASPLRGRQVELVSVCEWECVSVALCIFDDAHLKQTKAEGKTNSYVKKTNMQQRINNTLSGRWQWITRTAWGRLNMYVARPYLFSPCAATKTNSISAVMAIGRKIQQMNSWSMRHSVCW